MKAIIKILAVIYLIILFVGCSKTDASTNATRLRIKLTDAPALTLSELNVDIRTIEVSTVDTTNNSEKWTPLNFNGGVYNVLPLSNGKSKQIVDQYFPAGVLRRIKIVFGTNSTLKMAEEIKNLVLDPKIKDGIIMDVHANLYANYVTSIMIDINAMLSIYESNGNYFFRPVIRVFPEAFGGSLKGIALPREANPVVIVTYDKADTLLSIPESGNGSFLFNGLKEGVWKIHVQPFDSKSEYKDTVFTDTVFTRKIRDVKTITLKKK